MKLSVVMPVYNEGPAIRRNLVRTLDVLRPLGPVEVIVVDDGSTDNTAAELDAAAAELPELRVLHRPHQGKGEALRQGTRAAHGEFVIFLDADLDLPPEQIELFLILQKTHQADAVIGSKMHPDSNVEYPLRRRVYSLAYYCLTKALFGLPVRDTQTGLKLVRRKLLLEALKQMDQQGFAFDLELLVNLVRVGAQMVEAPVVVRHQVKFGGIGLGTVYEIAAETFKIWIRRQSHPRVPAAAEHQPTR